MLAGSNIHRILLQELARSGRQRQAELIQATQAVSRRCNSTAPEQGSSSGVEPERARAALGYCVQQVKTYDYGNYVWMVQLPKELRPPLFALRAFNVETARIAEQVRSGEPALVQMRFQWWRDALAAVARGQPPTNPVCLAMASVNLGAATAQQRYHLRRILDTREADQLDAQPPLGVSGLEQYAEGTASALLYLHLGAAGASGRDADHAASHVGKAVGLATLLRGTPVHAAARRSYLPVDLCAQYQVSQEDVYSGQPSEGLRDVVLKVASVAHAHLEEARSMSAALSPVARQMLLPAVAASHYLRALEGCNFNVFDPKLLHGGVTPLWHALSIKYHLLARSF